MHRDCYIVDVVDQLSYRDIHSYKTTTNYDESDSKTYQELDIEDNLKLVNDLIDILSDERAKDRNEWIKIGWIINNISNGAHEGLDIWIKFSKRCSEQFKNGGKSICINEWRQMETKDLGIGTLKYMAKIDNHEQYDIIMKKYMAKYYIDDKDNIKNTHYDVASALLQNMEMNIYVVL